LSAKFPSGAWIFLRLIDLSLSKPNKLPKTAQSLESVSGLRFAKADHGLIYKFVFEVRMRQLKTILFCGVLILTSCEARRVEKPVKSVNGAAATLEESKVFSANLDKRVNEFVTHLDKLNRQVKILVRFIKSRDASASEYTPIDFLIDVLNETRKGVAMKRNTTFKKEGSFELPASVVSESNSCRVVKTLLEGNVDTDAKISNVTLSVSGCMFSRWQTR
jgi:hypothetical protein